jgi:hypothetical protein
MPLVINGPGSFSEKADLADLVDLAEAIDRDREAPASELRRRDREIGRRLEKGKDQPSGQLLAWLDEVSGGRRDFPGASAARILGSLRLLLAAAGLVIGWTAAAAVFYYDGRHPVNVISVLAVFVFLQILLVLLLLLTLLPGRALRSLPGFGAVLEVLELIRPGRLLELAAKRLPEKQRLRIRDILGRGRRQGSLYGAVGRWTVTLLSQVFAVAFNIGALAGAMQLVLFSDLAFAWSTTLQIPAARIHLVTSALAAPWASWMPAAAPGITLVESSRYFRLKEGILPSGAAEADPAVLGEWWPFLLMALAIYGLLPRLLLLVFASRRLQSAVHDSFGSWPGAANVLERMNGPLVDTRASEKEVAGARPRLKQADSELPALTGDRVCINWGEVPYGDDVLLSLAPGGTCVGALLSAGGGHSLDEDRETVRRAAGAGCAGATIFAKAWEPPMEDLLDFLVDLREALGRTAPLTVVLAGTPSKGVVSRVGGDVVRVWEARLSALADPWIFVEGSPGGAS